MTRQRFSPPDPDLWEVLERSFADEFADWEREQDNDDEAFQDIPDDE